MASPVPQTAAQNSGNSATPTITEPSGAAQDDLLFAVVGSADDATSITGLTGWTEEANVGFGGNRIWIGWIIRGASAPDLVAAAGNTNWVTGCIRITGHDSTTPIATFSSNTGSDAAPDPPSANPGSSGDYLSIALAVQSGKGTSYTPPSTPGTYTEQTDIGTSGAGPGTSHVSHSIATRAYTGQTEDPGTFTSSTNDGWGAFTFLIQPGASPQSQTVNAATETEAAQPVTAIIDQTVAVNEPTETESAQAVTVATSITVSVGAASEIEAAQPVTVQAATTIAVTAATETESAQPVVGFTDQTIAVGFAAEPEAAQPVLVTTATSITVTATVEIESGQVLTPSTGSGQSIGVTAVVETESAQPVSFTRSLVAARPDADTDKADWDSAPTPGQALYAQIDEVTTDDADYIFVELVV